jgi:hypothetical protein
MHDQHWRNPAPNENITVPPAPTQVPNLHLFAISRHYCRSIRANLGVRFRDNWERRKPRHDARLGAFAAVSTDRARRHRCLLPVASSRPRKRRASTHCCWGDCRSGIRPNFGRSSSIERFLEAAFRPKGDVRLLMGGLRNGSFATKEDLVLTSGRSRSCLFQCQSSG